MLGIIGGSSFLLSPYFADFHVFVVETKYGKVNLRKGKLKNVVFCQRHNSDPNCEYSPPHIINFRAVIQALKDQGCTRIIGFGSVGSLKSTLPVGSVVVPDDFFCISSVTYFDDARGHIVPTLNETLRQELLTALRTAGLKHIDTGVYLQTAGPRFETKAEIRCFTTWADIVGMTCAHEAVLTSELKLPYALICMVDNMANGLSKGRTDKEFHQGVKNNLNTVETILGVILKNLVEPQATHSISSSLQSDMKGSSEEGTIYDQTKLLSASKLTVSGSSISTSPSSSSRSISSPSLSSSPLTSISASSSPKTPVDLVVKGRYIVPVRPRNSLLENHALVVNKGKIVAILPHGEAEAKYLPSQLVQLHEHHVLLPGFVNTHTHIGMTMLRGYSDDKSLHDWLTQYIWPTEAKYVTPEFVRDSSMLAVAEMIKGGTTTFNDMYFFPGETAKVVEEVGVRAVLGIVILEFPTTYARNTKEYLDKGEQVLAEHKDKPNVRFSYSPHAPYTVSDETLESVYAMAQKKKMPFHTHLHETYDEVHHSVNEISSIARHLSKHAISPLKNFVRLGILENIIAVHMTQLSDEEIQLCAKHRVNVVHCPSSNLKLASGFCPISKLIEQGVNVAIGTDSTASNNSLDVMYELKTAAILSKAISRNARAVSAFQALEMATINGATAIHMQDEIGSLEVGKNADFIAINLGSIELAPVYDIISHVVYCASREHVTDVWVGGKQLLRNRELLTIDEMSLFKRSQLWQIQLAQFRIELDQKLLTQRLQNEQNEQKEQKDPKSDEGNKQ